MLTNIVYLMNMFYIHLGMGEFLTEAAGLWNYRKINSLPKMLVHRLQKMHIHLNVLRLHSLHHTIWLSPPLDGLFVPLRLKEG